MHGCLLALCVALPVLATPSAGSGGPPPAPSAQAAPQATAVSGTLSPAFSREGDPRLLAPLPAAALPADTTPKPPRPAGPPDRLFGEDKFTHFFTSFLVATLSASGARAAGLDHDASLLVGAGAGVALGAAKELHDRRTPGATASLLDLAWDLAGTGAGVAVVAQGR